MADFNDIGIPRQLDWPRVRKLLTIGVFGACGFHVPTCALVFLGKQGLPEETLARFALYFLLPATALFWVFFLLLAVTQIAALAKGRTPYPRWCWVFSPWWGASRPRPWAFSAISHSSTPSPAPGLPSAASGCSAASSAWPNQRSGAPTPSK